MTDSKIEDGGPAFPRPDERNAYDVVMRPGDPGMTLRDWFAGQAMAAMIPDIKVGETWGLMAADAYQASDEMLLERSKKRSA